MVQHPTDKKIIQALGARRLNANSLSEKTSIGKTTIQYRLGKMLENGLIQRFVISERKILYGVNKKAVNEARSSNIIEVFSGAHAIQAYRDFLESPKQSTIYSIQGMEAIERLVKSLPQGFVAGAHNRQKRKNILLKGFVHENIRQTIKAWPSEIVKSHIGRTVGLKMVEGKILRGPCEMLCTESVIMFHNTDKKRVVVVKDKEISRFIYEIIGFMYDNLQIPVFPLNEYLKQI